MIFTESRGKAYAVVAFRQRDPRSPDNQWHPLVVPLDEPGPPILAGVDLPWFTTATGARTAAALKRRDMDAVKLAGGE